MLHIVTGAGENIWTEEGLNTILEEGSSNLGASTFSFLI
jgi:hypothetical protein